VIDDILIKSEPLAVTINFKIRWFNISDVFIGQSIPVLIGIVILLNLEIYRFKVVPVL
jgi:hypothetical protein